MLFPRRLSLWALLATSATAFAGVNSWTGTGPDGGFARAVASDPSGNLLAATPGGIFRSTDSGQSWKLALEGVDLGIFAIVFDSTNPSRVMAADRSFLWSSNDGGQSFAKSTAPGGNFFRLAAGSDGSFYVAPFSGHVFRAVSFGSPWVEQSQGLPNEYIRDLVVDPLNAGTVYALLQTYGLYKSVNGGVWTLVIAENGNKFAIDPENSANFLLVGANGDLMESRNGGATWTRTSGGFSWVGFYPSTTTHGGAVAIPRQRSIVYRNDRNSGWQSGLAVELSDVYDVAFDPRDATGHTFLLASSEDPWLTQDSGVTFVVRSHGLRGSFATSLVAAGDAAGTIYAGYAAGPVGIHRRTSAGWAPVNNASLKARLQTSFNGYPNPQAIAVDPHDANVLVVGNDWVVVNSVDGGQSWGLPQTPPPGIVRALSFDTFDSRVVYAGVDTGNAQTAGVYRSVDGGNVFSLSSTGLAAPVGVLAVDRKIPGVLYAAVYNANPAPLIYKSTNNGANWASASSGLVPDWIDAIVVDPTDSHVLYAGGYGFQPGIAKSIDGGQSWQNVGAMSGTANTFRLAVDPVVPTNVFASRMTGAPARSVDGGATWEELPLKGRNEPQPNPIVLDPLKPSIVIGTDDRYGLIEYEVAPDLEVTLQVPPPTLALDGAGSLTLRVTNHGPLAASAVKLVLSPPASVMAAPVAGQGTCSKVGSSLECTLGAVRLNQSVDMQLALTGATASGQSTLGVSVVGHESDPVSANDSLSVPLTTDRIANVGVALSSSASAVDPNGQLILTATLSNAGPNPSNDDTRLVIPLGIGLTYQSATASQGTCTAAGAVVTCAVGAVAAGAQPTVAVTVTASGGGTLSPSAQILATGTDPVASNNSAATSIAVNVPRSSGGGGASGVVELLSLLAAAVARRRAANLSTLRMSVMDFVARIRSHTEQRVERAPAHRHR